MVSLYAPGVAYRPHKDWYTNEPYNDRELTVMLYVNAADWGAEGEAYLTDHGAAVIRRMGAYHRQLLVDSGFLPSDGSKVTVYADDDPTGRDVKTASAFFDEVGIIGLYQDLSRDGKCDALRSIDPQQIHKVPEAS